MNKISGFILVLAFSMPAMATECDVEMAKFSISKAKQAQICGYFSDSIFGTFKSCVFSAVRKFRKDASESDIHGIPEKSIQGILNLCAGFEVDGQSPKSSGKRSTTAP